MITKKGPRLHAAPFLYKLLARIYLAAGVAGDAGAAGEAGVAGDAISF